MTPRMVTAILLLSSARLLQADDGTVIVRRESGGLVVTAFASALRTGIIDLSVLVQNREGLDPVLDATVELTLTSPDGHEIAVVATHALAQNKLLYAVPVPLDQRGRWTIAIIVWRTGSSVSVGGSFDVAASGAIVCWKYLAIPPAFLLLFTLHQWLAHRQGRLRGSQ